MRNEHPEAGQSVQTPRGIAHAQGKRSKRRHPRHGGQADVVCFCTGPRQREPVDAALQPDGVQQQRDVARHRQRADLRARAHSKKDMAS